MNKPKPKTLNIILAIILILLIGYIVVDKYIEAKQKEKLDIFQQGMQAGYEQAIVQVVQQAATCQPVPITIKNQTLEIIATACLRTTEE